MSSITKAAPQFLVSELARAIRFYGDQLGFTTDFVYDDFYASVSRDGATIHLKCAAKNEAERLHRKSGEHLDAFLEVTDVASIHAELADRGVTLLRPMAERPWGAVDFYVEDPDGYILCFSQVAT